jgi:transcriptional regulator with XRE-family HTH domain
MNERSHHLSEVWSRRSAELGVSQADAARSLGFRSQAAVSQYLSGKVPLGLEAACRFAEFLKVPIRDISPGFAKILAAAAFGEPDEASESSVSLMTAIITGLASTEPLLDANSGATVRSYAIVDRSVASIEEDGSYAIVVGGTSSLWNVKRGEDSLTLFSSTDPGRSLTLNNDAKAVLQVKGKAIGTLNVL